MEIVGPGGDVDESSSPSAARLPMGRSRATVSRRSRLTSRPRKGARSSAPNDESERLPQRSQSTQSERRRVSRSEELDVPSLLASLPVYLSVAQHARLLWTTGYWMIFMLEIQQFQSVGVSQPLLDLFSSIRSSRQGELAEDGAALLRLSATVAATARERSRQIIPFSIVAKSISWLMQRVPNRVWNAELRLRRLVSKAYAINVLRAALLCRPPPSFEAHTEEVGFAYADQTYIMQGTSSKPQRVQYIDGQNLPVQIERETVLNMVDIPVPRAVTPQLDAAALTEIRRDGVYRQPFTDVLLHLSPDRVRADLVSFLASILSLVAARATELGCSVDALSEEDIAKVVVGRPNVDPGGPTYFTILETERQCSTQSYGDGFKIIRKVHRAIGKRPVIRLGGDGQLVLLLSYLKRRFPEAHKHILIDSGDFHAFAHFMFALNELYWLCFICCCARELEIDNVYERMPNLENNNYEKVRSLHNPITVAVLIFFFTRVQRPSPLLLMANPMAYKQQINSSGGLILFYFLLQVGSPEVWYNRSIRAGNGSQIPKIQAWALHVFRTVHTTQEQIITLIALVSFYCIHPALKPFKTVMCGISLLGRFGANMAFDRLVEWVNCRQSERSSSFQSYEGALQFTPLIQPMLHADAAFSAAALGASTDADSGYDPRMLNQVRRLLRMFEQELGTDLTVPSANNPFWHTGSVQLAGGSTREYRPYDLVFEVEAGRLPGRQAARQSFRAWATDQLANHFFHM